MSKQRLFPRITTIAVFVAVFAVGSYASAQITWVGTTSSWTTASNWSPATVPTAASTVIFDGAASAIPTTPSTGATVAQINVTDSQTLNLDGTFTVTTLNIDAGTTFELTKTSRGVFNLAGTATFDSGSKVIGGGTTLPVTFNIQSTGKVNMQGYAESTSDTHFGENIFTVIANNTFMLSDVVFLDDIDISTAGLALGSRDLYLGKGVTVSPQLAWNSSNSKSDYTDGWIACDGGVNNAGQGRVKREFSEIGDSFLFPVGQKGDWYTPIQITISCQTLFDHDNDPNTPEVYPLPDGSQTQSYISSIAPFPHISVRAVLQKGGDKGHPANENKSEIWIYWVVKDEDDNLNHSLGRGDGLPNLLYPTDPGSIGFTGTMYFSNTYRTGTPASLFSAVYTDHVEDDPSSQNYAGPWGGDWILNGSVIVTSTSGDTRQIPFGGGSYPNDCTVGFGDYSVGVVGEILPVELTSFSGRYYADDSSVRLSWVTATELNNLGFWVERTVDGEHWETLPDFVQGAGNSSVPLNYSYTDRLDDRLAQAPQIAYRLRQVDRDGTIEYSSIVYVATGARAESVELYKAYPNPFNPSTTLSFSLEENENVTLRVYNTLGMEVATLLNGQAMDAGFHTVEFRGEDLVSGVYFAVLEAAGTVRQQKLVLSK